MVRGKMPKMCANNGLMVDILPDKNLQLSELENNLIALNIVFQKIHLKPKSRWSGTHDRLVNVPVGPQDVLNTIESLPRTPAEAGIIPIIVKTQRNSTQLNSKATSVGVRHSSHVYPTPPHPTTHKLFGHF